jgi:hypothetical protein
MTTANRRSASNCEISDFTDLAIRDPIYLTPSASDAPARKYTTWMSKRRHPPPCLDSCVQSIGVEATPYFTSTTFT